MSDTWLRPGLSDEARGDFGIVPLSAQSGTQVFAAAIMGFFGWHDHVADCAAERSAPLHRRAAFASQSKIQEVGLLFPSDRKVSQPRQTMCIQLNRLRSVEDCFGYLWCKEGERQDTADFGQVSAEAFRHP